MQSRSLTLIFASMFALGSGFAFTADAGTAQELAVDGTTGGQTLSLASPLDDGILPDACDPESDPEDLISDCAGNETKAVGHIGSGTGEDGCEEYNQTVTCTVYDELPCDPIADQEPPGNCTIHEELLDEINALVAIVTGGGDADDHCSSTGDGNGTEVCGVYNTVDPVRDDAGGEAESAVENATREGDAVQAILAGDGDDHCDGDGNGTYACAAYKEASSIDPTTESAAAEEILAGNGTAACAGAPHNQTRTCEGYQTVPEDVRSEVETLLADPLGPVDDADPDERDYCRGVPGVLSVCYGWNKEHTGMTWGQARLKSAGLGGTYEGAWLEVMGEVIPI